MILMPALDPVKYACVKADRMCFDCVFHRLYPQSEKPCFEWLFDMGMNATKRENQEYERWLRTGKARK